MQLPKCQRTVFVTVVGPLLFDHFSYFPFTCVPFMTAPVLNIPLAKPAVTWQVWFGLHDVCVLVLAF